MIIAKIVGGLGNQLRAFSCGYTVSQYLNQPLVLDISDYTSGYFRPYILDMLSIPDCTKIYYPHTKALYHCIDAAPDSLQRTVDTVIETDRVRSRQELLALCAGHENIYLQGYAGIEFCTPAEIAALRRLFFPHKTSAFFEKLSGLVKMQESVSIHVRRTDFISTGWTDNSSADYYNAAVAYMKSRLSSPQFYFFSDDMEWVHGIFGEQPEYHYVNLVGGVLADIEELFIMSACRHHILTARSTYGWWGAFLSPHTSGINICSGDGSGDTMFRLIENIIFFDSEKIKEYNCNDCNCGSRDSNILDDKSVPVGAFISDAAAFPGGAYEPAGIDEIDGASVSKQALSPAQYFSLLEKKTLAMLQEVRSEHFSYGISYDIDEILSCMDKLMQTKRDSFDFWCSCSLALYYANRFSESILYAANARRLKKDSSVPRWICDMTTDDKELYFSLSDKLCQSPATHYFFLNINFWDNVKGFYDSLEIILRNLGNEVTLLECGVDDSNPSGTLDEAITQKQSLDCVYRYDIDRYRLHCTSDEDFFPHAKELIDRTKKQDCVKVITHFADGLICDVSPYPVYYIDGCSKWDVWKYITDCYDSDTFNAICALSAKVFTPREVMPCYSQKTVRPVCEAGTDARKTDSAAAFEPDIFEIKDRFTNHDCYMRNESVIQEIIQILLNL